MARAPGDIFGEIVARAGQLAAFQEQLNALPRASERKTAVMSAHCMGLLTHDETTMLFEIYALANA